MLRYIYSYLKKGRKQCVIVNNIESTFEETISKVPQEILNYWNYWTSFSITFSILYKLLWQKILQMTVTFAKIIENPISILESEKEVGINWFKINLTIVNPDKF